MSREILFKAKRIDNGEWVEGFYCIKKPYCFDDRIISSLRIIIITEHSSTGTVSFEVNPDTICQYTGLTDKNGNKIWENDIVEYRDCTDEQYVVAWETSKAMFEHQQYGCSIMNFDELSGMEVEVIGNIFDNPELI